MAAVLGRPATQRGHVRLGPGLINEDQALRIKPARQLRLVSFLQEQAKRERTDGQRIQIIVTTHSPNLASDLNLDNLALIEGGRAFPLSKGKTKLSASDYRFLERFLDIAVENGLPDICRSRVLALSNEFTQVGRPVTNGRACRIVCS